MLSGKQCGHTSACGLPTHEGLLCWGVRGLILFDSMNSELTIYTVAWEYRTLWVYLGRHYLLSGYCMEQVRNSEWRDRGGERRTHIFS